MPNGTRVLSLIQAYAFGVAKGLNDPVAEIRSMALDGVPEDRKSATRRGYIVQLFRDHGCLEEFIDTHWPNGRTNDGERRLRRCEQLRLRHQAILGEEDESHDVDDRDEEAAGPAFALESQLRDFLANNLGVLERGLHLYEDSDGRRGIEYPVDGGRIDVLAVGDDGRYAVIELKLSRGRNRAIGQLAYYMAWVDRHLPAASPDKRCRGIIVAEAISPELQLAAARVPDVALYRYKISMTVEAVGSIDES